MASNAVSNIDKMDGAVHGLRILIASYFFAAASGLAAMVSGIAAYAAALPHTVEGWVFASVACAAAAVTMFGRLARAAALVLFIYVIWANLFQANAAAEPLAALGVMMRDTTLVAALFLLSRVKPVIAADTLVLTDPVMMPIVRAAARPFPRLTGPGRVRPRRPKVVAKPRREIAHEESDMESILAGLDRAVNALAERRTA